jgi:hypothetical protein
MSIMGARRYGSGWPHWPGPPGWPVRCGGAVRWSELVTSPNFAADAVDCSIAMEDGSHGGMPRLQPYPTIREGRDCSEHYSTSRLRVA